MGWNMPSNKINFIFRILHTKLRLLKKYLDAKQYDSHAKNILSDVNLSHLLNLLEINFISKNLNTSSIPLARSLADDAVKCVQSKNWTQLAAVVPALESAIQEIENVNLDFADKPPELYFEKPSLASTSFFTSYGGYNTQSAESEKIVQDELNKLIAAMEESLDSLPKPFASYFYTPSIIKNLGFVLLENRTVFNAGFIKTMHESILYAIGAFFINTLAKIDTNLPDYITTYLSQQLILQQEFYSTNPSQYKNAQGIMLFRQQTQMYNELKNINNIEVLTQLFSPDKESAGMTGYIKDCKLIAEALIKTFEYRYAGLNFVNQSECSYENAKQYGTKVFGALNENCVTLDVRIALFNETTQLAAAAQHRKGYH